MSRPGMNPRQRPRDSVKLSRQHRAALARRRRVVVNVDMVCDWRALTDIPAQELAQSLLWFADQPDSQIDSIWWSWGEGNQAPYPSEVLPLYDLPEFRKLVASGIDLPEVLLAATHRRGLEAFFSYRMNGSDNDLGPIASIPLKEEHPNWLIPAPWGPKYWNFAIPEVREHKVRVLQEAAERYAFDGIELDFARVPLVLPPGAQWEHREHLTAFVRSVRCMLLEVEARRGRPMLLAARVSENLPGCHFDGMDVETWARLGLVDILTLGCRSIDVDLAGFRQATAGTGVKLYPCHDDHHASDGYREAPIEVLRGIFANWWEQGADGIETFNFAWTAPQSLSEEHRVKAYITESWAVHAEVYTQMGDPATLRGRDKVFALQRRGGGHGRTVLPDPEDWSTPRLIHLNTNMLAPLPAQLDEAGRADTLLVLRVADAVAESTDRDVGKVERVTLRLLLHDLGGDYLVLGDPKELPPEAGEERMARGLIRRSTLFNHPPLRTVAQRIEVRVNNILLERPVVDAGWLVFGLRPQALAVGGNLVGIIVPDGGVGRLTVERLEVHVRYTRG